MKSAGEGWGRSAWRLYGEGILPTRQKNSPPPFLIWKDRRAPAFGYLDSFEFFFCWVMSFRHPLFYSVTFKRRFFLNIFQKRSSARKNGQKRFAVQSGVSKNWGCLTNLYFSKTAADDHCVAFDAAKMGAFLLPCKCLTRTNQKKWQYALPTWQNLSPIFENLSIHAPCVYWHYDIREHKMRSLEFFHTMNFF